MANRAPARPPKFLAEKNNLHDTFASRLGAKMRERGLTQTELSRLAFQSDSTTSAHIQGASIPSFHQVWLYARALGVSIAELCE